jgi:ubiquinone/menaquinone biosynthesis C-methylase UbiE
MNTKRQHFNELAGRWDSLPAPDHAPAKAREFVRRVAAAKCERVLDVGCGTGILLPHLLEFCSPLTRILELDYAEAMLRENARKSAQARVVRACADAEHLPFRAGTFDHVLCFGVLPHFADLPAALEELFRVLRPAGTLAVGHAMGSRELNSLHGSLGGPTAGDTLPPAASLAQTLRDMGAKIAAAEEQPDRYFVQATKTA